MTGPDRPELEQRLTDYLTRSDAALLRGEDAFRRRQGREAIRELFLACYLAANALNLSAGFDPGREISPGALAKDPHGVFAGPATRSLGRFYHRLHQYKTPARQRPENLRQYRGSGQLAKRGDYLRRRDEGDGAGGCWGLGISFIEG